MINHAYISRYKSVAEAHIDFGPINVIVGQNANGKSNIIDALCFVHDCINEDLDTAIVKRHGIESIRQWSKTRPYHITIDLELSSEAGNGNYRFVISSGRGSYKVVEESGSWTGFNPFSSTDGKPSREKITVSFSRTEDGNVTFNSDFQQVTDHISRITLPSYELYGTSLAGPYMSMQSIVLKPLSDAIQSFVAYSIYPNTLREPRVVSRQDRLLPDGSNLPSILRMINSGYKKSKESIVDSLRLIMPNVADVTVRSAGGYYVPIIQVKEYSGEIHQFNMSQVSDGTLRVLGILAAFYQPNSPTIIALEEPEQMVHPGILPVITEAAEEFCASSSHARQVFMTTHSPALLDLVEPESIIWTKQVDGVTKCGPINARQLSLIRKNLFSAGEVFLSEGFVEQ